MSTCENRNMKRLIMLDGIFGFSAPYLKGIFSLKKKKSKSVFLLMMCDHWDQRLNNVTAFKGIRLTHRKESRRAYISACRRKCFIKLFFFFPVFLFFLKAHGLVFFITCLGK